MREDFLNLLRQAMLGNVLAFILHAFPYRLPVTCGTCKSSALGLRRRALLAAQRAQDAQTGYACDYCGKNQPMAYKEIKEFRKGHQNLHAAHAQEAPGKLGRRHVSRFLSDAYCKGIVRGQVECCNLRATYQETYAVAAESLRTSATVAFPGAQYLAFVKQVQDRTNAVPRQRALTLVRRHARRGPVLEAKDVALLYALRPTDETVWFLSPYELTVHWSSVPTRVPSRLSDLEQDGHEAWDVDLTVLPEAAKSAGHARRERKNDKRVLSALDVAGAEGHGARAARVGFAQSGRLGRRAAEMDGWRHFVRGS